MSGTSPAFSTTVTAGFDETVSATREALAAQGFGVVTEIDMRQTLKAKLDRDIEDYLILGACTPAFAHHALTLDRSVGVLLPCNVVVRRDPADAAKVHVEAVNPPALFAVVDDAVAEDSRPVGDKLAAAVEAVSGRF